MHTKKSANLQSSTTEAVESPALPLESLDHVHDGDGLPLCVLSAGDGIMDDIERSYFNSLNMDYWHLAFKLAESDFPIQYKNCWMLIFV